MTKRERQMKSMLNYYGIDTGSNKDETMSNREQKKFLDTLNANYDAHTVQDILSKIKDKFKDKNKEQEESDDPFFDSLKKDEEDSGRDFPLDPNIFPGKKPWFNHNEMLNFGFMGLNLNPEIEKFITWISDLLYSADHKVIITEEGDITNIKLQKIKKKGGRKK